MSAFRYRLRCPAGGPARQALLALALCACLASLLAACGVHSTVTTTATATAGARTTATAQAQATAAATPVRLAVSATQTGTVMEHDVRLAFTVTVTNTTAAPIFLVGLLCTPPAIHADLGNTILRTIWHNWTPLSGCVKGGGCPTLSAPDTQGPDVLPDREIASHGTYTWTASGDLSQVRALTQPGPYTLIITTGWVATPPPCDDAAANPPPAPIYHELKTTQSITLR